MCRRGKSCETRKSSWTVKTGLFSTSVESGELGMESFLIICFQEHCWHTARCHDELVRKSFIFVSSPCLFLIFNKVFISVNSWQTKILSNSWLQDHEFFIFLASHWSTEANQLPKTFSSWQNSLQWNAKWNYIINMLSIIKICGVFFWDESKVVEKFQNDKVSRKWVKHENF